jgi:AraC-like DNA-binding protein
MTRFRLSSLIAPRLRELSVDPEAVFRHAGLPAGLLHQEKIFLTTEQFFAFWTAIESLSANPAIGLELGSQDRVERHDLVALAALSASSFRDALERVARYKQLTCPEEIRVVEQDGESMLQFGWTLATEVEPSVLVDLCFAWMTGIARRGTANAIAPLRAELNRSSQRREMYQTHLGCPVLFDAPMNQLVFRTSDLDVPFVTHHADLLAILAPQLEADLADRRASEDIRDQVKAVLRRVLAGRRPDLGRVARELGASARTLQRRLGDMGVTFQQVLEEARRDMASHYLLHSSLDLAEIAYLLGYEDANSFFRAFHQWEGASPGKWRELRKATLTAAAS